MGEILLAVVAIAVTAFTAGALAPVMAGVAGSLGLATGAAAGAAAVAGSEAAIAGGIVAGPIGGAAGRGGSCVNVRRRWFGKTTGYSWGQCSGIRSNRAEQVATHHRPNFAAKGADPLRALRRLGGCLRAEE